MCFCTFNKFQIYLCLPHHTRYVYLCMCKHTYIHTYNIFIFCLMNICLQIFRYDSYGPMEENENRLRYKIKCIRTRTHTRTYIYVCMYTYKHLRNDFITLLKQSATTNEQSNRTNRWQNIRLPDCLSVCHIRLLSYKCKNVATSLFSIVCVWLWMCVWVWQASAMCIFFSAAI